ncbi:FAD-dependent monooxygenase [Aureimonas populi]|uniref:FAD-dependent monooxygenase n=1 Tax=Aureimonas populi TaxID=1701758 RepID=A0ABW5CQ67_9HYPH|nr:FAD-dependent monooxygenase [Aureimonas populi]
MTERSRSAIPIVGAGIGGLAVGLALARAGFDADIFERTTRFEEVGAGIQLSANALLVLERLGVFGLVCSASTAAEAVTLRDARSGKAIAHVPVTSREGSGYLVLHRADLHRALAEAVASEPRLELHTGVELTGLSADGGRAVLRLKRDGREFERAHPIAIAADGARSAAVSSLGLAPARPTGRVADRFVVDQGAASPALAASIEAWLSSGRHIVTYPVRGGRLLNIVVIGPDKTEPPSGEALWSGLAAPLGEALRRARYLGRWPLLSAPAKRRLVHGGALALVGDAGHAMPPFAAQGAAMAIEDAYVLAQSLCLEPDPRLALRRYEAERLPRLARLRSRVAFHRFVYHLPRPFSFARDAVLAMRSPSSLRDDLAWLYDWRP